MNIKTKQKMNQIADRTGFQFDTTRSHKFNILLLLYYSYIVYDIFCSDETVKNKCIMKFGNGKQMREVILFNLPFCYFVDLAFQSFFFL